MPDFSEQLERMLEALHGSRRLTIVTHDHPDPDALASAVGLRHLLHVTSQVACSVAYGGTVGRPENRALVRMMKLPPVNPKAMLPRPGRVFALIDTQPAVGNNSLPESVIPRVVIDHHPLRHQTRQVPFYDIRTDYGATATLIADYLVAARAPIDGRLATAICYAISSETQNLGREAAPADIAAYTRLFPIANKRALATLVTPKRPRGFYRDLARALRNGFLYRNVIGTWLPAVDHPDIVPQLADFLLRHERVSWSIGLGYYGERLYLSIRTTQTQAHCHRLIRRLVGSRGKAGGHGMIAGGFIDCGELDQEDKKKLAEDIVRRFLALVGHGEVEVLSPLLPPGSASREETESAAPTGKKTDSWSS
jgi:nanoRNase/pAp phosphatase (c-di-AMP/oligoRNAs hydrolase)